LQSPRSALAWQERTTDGGVAGSDRSPRHQRSNGACIARLNNSSTAAPDNNDNSIEMIRAVDRYTAVYATAERVIELVEGGYEFRDIAILCGDRGKYEKILQNVFDRKGIPVFVDTEIDILSHPLTELVRAALEIVVKGWGFDGVFRFLIILLTKVAQETIDTMENYALANGVFLPNTYRHRYPLKCEVAESGRLQLLDAMKPFEKKRGDSKDTVKNHAKRVFEMLYGLDVPGVLLKWYDAQMQNGDPETARLHGQIWPKLCEVFDKLVEILGDEKVTLKTFAATLDAGLCQVGLGRIPPTTNQIVLGDIGRSRYPKIHAMLVLGANEGVLMPTPTQSGLLTDYERKILRNSGTEIAPDNLLRVSEMNYNLQNALAQPSERLIFIYAEAEPSGKPLKPAQIIGQIKKAFPAVKTTAAASVSEFPAEGSVFFEPLNLSTETTNELYGKTIFTAATRLEAFAKCPFAYFMNYVLRARPRKQYEVLPADLGSLFHDVIADFTKQAGDFNLPREKVNFMINELIDGLELEDSIFHGTARNKYILEKVRRVAAASCYALCQQMRNNEYKPVMVEHEIHAKIPIANGKTLALTGRVDRVDISDLEKIKIIDYKTGSTKFSQKDALLGVQLQLPLYMNAITAARKNSTPGGIFYFPISDPIINTDIVLENAIREEKLLKEFKLSGIEVADFTKSGQMDAEAFAEFSRGIEATAKNLGNRLASGEIIAAPFAKGDNSPCRYCPHGGVCAK
jgi:ATP-dependent helicase/nuclease subunit B